MQALSDRTASFTDSVIRRMTRISNQYGAVNLSQGFPDFDPPKPILDRLSQVAYEDFHQYSITWGAQNFREALAAKQTRYMGRTIDPNSEIVVTCGSTEAMMTAMMTVTNPARRSRIALGGSKSGKPWERFTAPYWLEIRVMRRMTESVKPAVRSESGCIGRSPLLFIPICLLGYFALYRGSAGSSMPFRGNFAFWKIAGIIKETDKS